MKTSVALCTYNGSRYLQAQLDSIASQTLLPDEIVICDDGSNDNTADIVAKFSRSSPFPVRLIMNDKTLGATKNFEKAIALCNHDAIFLSDQDDIWKPAKIERLVAELERYPATQYAFSNADTMDSEGKLAKQSLWHLVGLRNGQRQFVGEGQLRILLKRNVVTGATMVLRKSLRDFILPIPATWVHDHWIALVGSALFKGCAVPDRLIFYRRHSSQLIGAGRRTISQNTKESLGTDAGAYDEKVTRFTQLVKRVSAYVGSVVDETTMCLLEDKLTHLQARAGIRNAVPLHRINGTIREMLTGRYSRYSDSFCSIARDLFPAELVNRHAATAPRRKEA